MTNSSHSFLSGAPPLWALLSLASRDLSALYCCADMSRSPARSGQVVTYNHLLLWKRSRKVFTSFRLVSKSPTSSRKVWGSPAAVGILGT